MLSIVPKWRVRFDFANDTPLTIYISDHFASNVLRKAAEIDFGIAKTVRSVTIEAEAKPESQTSVVTLSPEQIKFQRDISQGCTCHITPWACPQHSGNVTWPSGG